ncbi:hypothetical protein ACB098_01G011500 [Castanea mollissima]|uniref:Uncharacterized protein n=1 Tax=Castanea mollissima TaxID=60419 RepID=A0A8J4VWK7_9ROSI|nr:hypothetical protein CMV_011893 [Castanea mollissima]
MALSKASLMAHMALLFITALSLIGAARAQVEAPAPSPTSPAAAIAPSVASALFAAVAALVFGSSLRI